MKDFTAYLNETEEIGFVEQVADAIIYVSGLPKVKPEVLVVFKKHIKPGTRVTRTNEILKVPVGYELLGRVINPLGNSIDTTKPLKTPPEKRGVNTHPAGIIKRRAITKQFETGVLKVDLAIPLGHGQRELIVGDRKTGKTSFLTKTILNQAKRGNICVYAAIGKR